MTSSINPESAPSPQFVHVPVPAHLVTGVMRFIAEHDSSPATNDPASGGGGAIDVNDPRPRVTGDDWSVGDFQLLMRDVRPSARRMVNVLDVLVEAPDKEVSGTSLAKAANLSRGELRGALGGFTRVCKSLRPDVRLDWPIIWTNGPSAHDGQDQETYYHVRPGVAEKWKQARAAH